MLGIIFNRVLSLFCLKPIKAGNCLLLTIAHPITVLRYPNSFCQRDKRINLLVSNEHHGMVITRNLSIERAKGRFIAFLDWG